MTDTEKNEAVARKLGWKLFDQHYQYWIPPTIEATHKYGDRPSHLPLYTKSIDAAWEIVQHLEGEYFSVSKCLEQYDGHRWTAQVGSLSLMTDKFRGYADTAPMAIVDAFLKVP